MKKLTFEERAIEFALGEPIEKVQSVLTTMKVILAKRSPKPVRARRSSTIPGVPGTVKPAEGEV